MTVGVAERQRNIFESDDALDVLGGVEADDGVFVHSLARQHSAEAMAGRENPTFVDQASAAGATPIFVINLMIF